MMNYNIKVKNGIAFNLDDDHQFKLYEHICKIPNVSSYIKRLISNDLQGNSGAVIEAVPTHVEEVELSNDSMLGFI